MPIHHVKEQPAVSTYVQKKGCPTCDTNRGTPCICGLILGNILGRTIILQNMPSML